MRWVDVEREAPELARKAKAFLDGHTHLTIATLRKDGSPRISGTEIRWEDGDLVIGSMWKAMKALDLERDGRYALHSGSDDPDAGWEGDAKVAGRVARAETRDHAGSPSHFFALDVTELVIVGLNEARDKKLVESWHEGRGTTRIER